MENIFRKEKQRSKGSNPSAKKLKSPNYSSSALIVYSPAEMSQLTCRIFGLQHTWQSSTYCWRIPAEESMLVSFHSPHPAH